MASTTPLRAAADRALVSGDHLAALDLAAQALVEDPTDLLAAGLVARARAGLAGASRAGAELRQLTIVAVDMVRSTAMAARLGPEVYRELMLDLYGVCADAATRFEGRVTKYVGDGVLAQFGHPIAHEDDPRRATLAAFAMLEGVERLADRWEDRVGERPAVRIGLDAGPVAIGPVAGTPWAFEEIAGDPPNVASRVQAMAEPMTIRATGAVNGLIAGWFETVPVGTVELRNFPRPVALYRVLRPTEAESRLEASIRPRPPLVGRDEELAVLHAAWGDVVRGERRVAALTGEAGIGKSRLAEHVVATAVAAGATPLVVACSRLQQDSPLRPVARAMRRLFGVTPEQPTQEGLSRIASRLAELPDREIPTEESVPLLGRLVGLDAAVDLQPDVLRRREFDVIVDLVEAICARAPAVLHVDDVDTADPSTLELLTRLLSGPVRGLLVVLTGRGPLPEIAAVDRTLAVSGLPPVAAGELARGTAPDLPAESVERIVARCAGVPFYLEELSRAAATTRAQVAQEPIALDAFVAARLDELGPEIRRLAGLVSIGGDELDVDVLADLADTDRPVLDASLTSLAGAGIVLRVDGPSGAAVRFRHGVLREAAYGTMLARDRVRLHARLADCLVDRPPGRVRPEDLGRHLDLGERPAHAAAAWLDAARSAAAGGAHREAAGFYGRVLDALGRVPAGEQPPFALEAHLGLGAALSTCEGYTSPRARESFEASAAIAGVLDDSVAIFPALWGIWTYWFVLGEHDRAVGLGERCLAIARANPQEPRLRWAAGAIVGYQRLYLGDAAGARDELAIAVEHVGTEPVADFPQDPGIVSCSALAAAHWFLGEHQESDRVAARALALVDAQDPAGRRSAFTEAWVACTLAWRAQLADDPAAALDLSGRAVAISAANGFLTWLGAATLHQSIALCALGRVDEGLPVLATVVDGWRAAGRDADGTQIHPVLMTPYFAGRLAEVHLATGNAAAALAEAEGLLASTASSGERFWDTELRRVREAARAELDGGRA